MIDPISGLVYGRHHFSDVSRFMHISFIQKLSETACSLGTQWIDRDICLTTSNKWVQKKSKGSIWMGQHFRRSSIWMELFFAKARYMNSVMFRNLARRPVTQLSLPPHSLPLPPHPPPRMYVAVPLARADRIQTDIQFNYQAIYINEHLCWGLTTRQPLLVILCRLPEKGRRGIEEIVEAMKEGQGRKRKRKESEDTEEIKHSPSTHTCCKDSRPCPTVSQYQLDALVTQDTRHLCHTRPPPHKRTKF